MPRRVPGGEAPRRRRARSTAIRPCQPGGQTAADRESLGQAQANLDRWAFAVADRRKRSGSTIAELAVQGDLLGLPTSAFPAQLAVERVVGRSALVAFEGNRYSVAPGRVGQTVTVTARLGELHLEILSAAGRRVARDRRAPAGAGQLLRGPEHARLLEQSVLTAFTTDWPCRRKANRPPGDVALTAGGSAARPRRGRRRGRRSFAS